MRHSHCSAPDTRENDMKIIPLSLFELGNFCANFICFNRASTRQTNKTEKRECHQNGRQLRALSILLSCCCCWRFQNSPFSWRRSSVNARGKRTLYIRFSWNTEQCERLLLLLLLLLLGIYCHLRFNFVLYSFASLRKLLFCGLP